METRDISHVNTNLRMSKTVKLIKLSHKTFICVNGTKTNNVFNPY